MCDMFLFPDIFQVFGHITFMEQKTTYSDLELDEVNRIHMEARGTNRCRQWTSRGGVSIGGEEWEKRVN